jgi:hypothetical protein
VPGSAAPAPPCCTTPPTCSPKHPTATVAALLHLRAAGLHVHQLPMFGFDTAALNYTQARA